MTNWTEDLLAGAAFVALIIAIWFGMVFLAHGGHIVLGR